MQDIIIKEESIKKFLYILMLLILVGIIIGQQVYLQHYKIRNSSTKISQKEIEEQRKNSSVIILKNNEKIFQYQEEKSNTENETNQTQNKTQEEINETMENEVTDQTTKPLSGKITFTIDKITSEVKGEDWAKVTKIKYTIDNQKQDFFPKLLVYCYDDNDEEDIKNYIEEEITLSKLKAGDLMIQESDVSITFNELDKTKTLKIKLYDDDTLLKTGTKTFKASS